jgi:hypothetical protein
MGGNISLSQAPTFIRNAGNDADAAIVVAAGSSVSFNGVLQSTVTGNPVGNGLIDAGIFMLPALLPPAQPAPPVIDNVFQGTIANLPQAGPVLPAAPVPKAKGDVVVESDDGC